MSRNAFAQCERDYNEAEERREQAAYERMKSETVCWKCSTPYQIAADTCPYCGSINGNVDPVGALKQTGKD